MQNLEKQKYFFNKITKSKKILDQKICFKCMEKGIALINFKCGHTFCKNCIEQKVQNLFEKKGNKKLLCLKCLLPHCCEILESKKIVEFANVSEKMEMEIPAEKPQNRYCELCGISKKISIPKCGHSFCYKCLKLYGENNCIAGNMLAHYDEKNCVPFICPIPGCNKLFDAELFLDIYGSSSTEFANELRENSNEEYKTLLASKLGPEILKERKEIANERKLNSVK